MNKENSQNHVIVKLHDSSYKVSIADAEEMRKALVRYIESQAVDLGQDTIARIQGSVSRIDPDGNLRIGSWLLESRFNRIVLTRRQQAENCFVFDVAYLEKTADGNWNVTALEQEHVSLRQ